MVLIIGVGNGYRSDDGLGLLIAREFARRQLDGVRVRECEGNAAGMLEMWEGYSTVIIVDAIRSGEAPGFLHCYDVLREGIPSRVHHTTSHSFGITEAIAMARELGRLPQQLFLAGIEACEIGQGSGLSDPVVKSIPELMASIERLIPRCDNGGREELREKREEKKINQKI